MRNGPRSTETTPPNSDYLLPLAARVALIQARDELRLLSQLAEPRGEGDRDEIILSTEALSDCFHRISEQIDEVLTVALRTE